MSPHVSPDDSLAAVTFRGDSPASQMSIDGGKELGMGSCQNAHPLAPLLAQLARAVSGTRVRWIEGLTDTRQRVYFANHTSHLDCIVLWAALPSAVRALARPVAARDYWAKGWLRRYVATVVFRSILIDRQPTVLGHRAGADRVIELLVEALGERDSVIVFPEGTRGAGQAVSPFKSGLYHLALRRPGIEFVPAYLHNLNRILPKGEFVPVPMLSTVTFGPAMRLEKGESKEDFLERARQAVLGLRCL